MSLVVETGTASSTAEAYESVANADTFIAAYRTSDSTWSGLSTAVKEDYLRRAAYIMDLQWGPYYKGEKYTKEQALEWPRSGAITSNGYSIDVDEIPTNLRRANIVLASIQGAGDELLDEIAASQNDGPKKKFLKLGQMSLLKEFHGVEGFKKRYPEVESLMRSLTSPGGGWMSPVGRA